MRVPKGYTEQQVLDIIAKVCGRLAGKFRFGYHDVKDIEQEGTIYALEGLEKYTSETGPLENFLSIHVRNRLSNYKRNNYERPDMPCLTCPFYDKHCALSSNQCAKFSDKSDCELYSGWMKRNGSKKNLMCPVDIGNVRDDNEINMRLTDNVEEVECNEIWEIIDKNLSMEFRADYLKIRNGVKVSKPRKEEVEQEILRIMAANAETKNLVGTDDANN